MKERYEIIKKLYPDYLILFKGKDKLKCVNKIILNNLDIEEKEEYDNNKYYLYYIKIKLINLIKERNS